VSFIKQNFLCLSFWYAQMVSEPKDSFICPEVRELFFASSLYKTYRLSVQVLTAAIVVVARRRKEYHVVAAVEGHELETPETEHRPGLERLLETTHLELDGKLFVNTQKAPTWRANCRRFDPGGSLDRRVNCRCVSQPRWVGARRNTRGKQQRGTAAS
jgi:hypothetical protein